MIRIGQTGPYKENVWTPRHVILQRDVEGVKSQIVYWMLGVYESTPRVLLHRERAKTRQSVAPCMDERQPTRGLQNPLRFEHVPDG